MRAHAALVGLSFVALAACSSKGTTSAAPVDAGAAGGDQLLAPPPAGQGVQYKMVSSLAAGQEIERVQFFVVPPEGLYVNREEVKYTAGSHHVLIYKTPYTAIPTVDVHGVTHDTSGILDAPSGGTADWQIDGVVAGAQSATAPPIVDGLPPGVAFKLDGGTVLLMNTHYLNASPNPVTVEARINMWSIPKEQVTEEAGIIFFYDPIIRVPAHSAGYSEMSCPVAANINVVNLQTHMHARGLGGQAFLTPPGGGAPQMIYESKNWEQVPVKPFAPPMQIAAGSTLDYHCNYQNDQDHTVLQGLSTRDEMCMLIGLYYPKDAKTELCSVDGTFSGISSAGTYFGQGGTTNCADSMKCLSSAKGADASYQCFLSACTKAAAPLHDVYRCALGVQPQCKTQCASDPTPGQCTTTCMQNACSTQVATCTTTPCN